MSCQNHPHKESVADCHFCGKKLCEDCSISIAGKNYCEECMSELVGPELANLAAKSPNTEIQGTTTPNQDSPIENQSFPTETQVPEKESSGIEPTAEKETPITEPTAEKVSQKAPLDDSQNIKDIEDNEHDDIYNDERLYNDTRIEENPSPTPNSNQFEEKYEKYLDDLYFDEKSEIRGNVGVTENKNPSLSEQLAQDEMEHGSITQDPFVPEAPEESMDFKSDANKNVPIMKNLRSVSSDNDGEENYTLFSLHKGTMHHKEGKKEPYSSTEKGLTVVLIILIILVAIYIIYLLTLHDLYPNFIDALFAFFENPGEVISHMIS
jgi:hypothetical protein